MTEEQRRIEAALDVINAYGGIDGDHHKQWTLDQVVRCLTGCPTVEESAVDIHGTRYTYEALGTCTEYEAWIAKHSNGEDGPHTYEWGEGIAP